MIWSPLNFYIWLVIYLANRIGDQLWTCLKPVILVVKFIYFSFNTKSWTVFEQHLHVIIFFPDLAIHVCRIGVCLVDVQWNSKSRAYVKLLKILCVTKIDFVIQKIQATQLVTQLIFSRSFDILRLVEILENSYKLRNNRTLILLLQTSNHGIHRSKMTWCILVFGAKLLKTWLTCITTGRKDQLLNPLAWKVTLIKPPWLQLLWHQ